MAHLPGPEEWIDESIHAGQGKVLEALLDGRVPVRRVCPVGTVGVRGGGNLRPTEVERAIVEPVAVLSSNVDTKRCLTKGWASATVHMRRPGEANVSKVECDIPVDDLVGPRRACLLGPNPPRSSVRSINGNWVSISPSIEGEVWVRVQYHPIRIRKIPSP